ncbi:hypothetical protein P0Y35_11715 [Kiritimatiellaeota bacterium B1221]|nr:hypothetical protein [Kiritimatiellaeota bacterium B1221]
MRIENPYKPKFKHTKKESDRLSNRYSVGFTDKENVKLIKYAKKKGITLTRAIREEILKCL